MEKNVEKTRQNRESGTRLRFFWPGSNSLASQQLRARAGGQFWPGL